MIKVDAETARGWLKNEAEFNRPSDPATVNAYARDMANGDWRISESAICFDEDGRLLNGGNRLRAVIVAEQTMGKKMEIPFWVIEGMDRDSYLVMDIGRKRGASDMAHAATGGVHSGKSMTIVRWYWQYRNNNPMGRSGRWAASPTRVQELQLFQSDPTGFEHSYQRGRDLQRQKIGNPNTGGLFHHILLKTPKIGSEMAEAWFDALVSGANLSDGSPILALRNRLMAGREGGSGNYGNRARPYTRQEQLYLYHRAWRAYCQDEHMTKIVLPPFKDGLNNQTFPKLYIPGEK
jgi:hypothetical protein